MARIGEAARQTLETTLSVRVDLDGTGRFQGRVDDGFFDHMLTAFAKTSGWDIEVTATIDAEVELHHGVEDTGIVLGQAVKAALGTGENVARFGHAVVPMDEALVEAVCDLSGRAYAAVELAPPSRMLGAYHTELTAEFCWGFARGCQITLHVEQRRGQNAHHITEAAYKALGLALGRATRIGRAGMPSTKGKLFD